MTDTEYRPKHRKTYAMDEEGNKLPGRRELVRVTIDENGEPTSAVAPKVAAATTGAGFGAALSTLIVWVLEYTTGVDFPPVVEGSILTVVVVFVTFAAGYIKRP